MAIPLTPEIEAALVEHLALEVLRQQFAPERRVDIASSGSLADFLGDSIGVLHSGEHIPEGASLSESKSVAFTQSLLKKRQQGKL